MLNDKYVKIENRKLAIQKNNQIVWKEMIYSWLQEKGMDYQIIGKRKNTFWWQRNL